MKKWIYRTVPEGVSEAGAHEPDLLEKLSISSELLHLIHLRGVDDPLAIDRFLTPLLRYLTPIEAWPGVLEAAQVLVDGILAGRKLVVWGDYDVDGITGTALALDVLEFHNVAVTHHLPDRRSEGYGLNIPAIEALAASGVGMVLTVDCGIGHNAAVARARELGMIIVVSDHHVPPETLPPAHAICNPRLGTSPCPDLAGVGVCFLLMAAANRLLEKHSGKRFDMRDVLDLVTLGTLADVVRLAPENRILVKNGLLKIAEAKRPGLAALKRVSKFDENASLGSGHVVFSLTPRINAAGRMGSPQAALDLLRAADADGAAVLAERLEGMNIERRCEENRILEHAREQASQYQDRVGLVLCGDDWHPGVIGIVASRIVDEFNKPTLVLCHEAGILKGSGRSIADFNLYEALASMSSLFIGFGGHKLAAGMSLSAENLPALREAFDQCVRDTFGDTLPTPILYIDAPLDFSKASDMCFIRELEMLQPFGPGNSEPVFASPLLRVRSRRYLGNKKEHVLLELLDESTGICLCAKAWGMADQLAAVTEGTHLHVAYSPRIDNYSGVDTVDIRIRDWTLEA